MTTDNDGSYQSASLLGQAAVQTPISESEGTGNGSLIVIGGDNATLTGGSGQTLLVDLGNNDTLVGGSGATTAIELGDGNVTTLSNATITFGDGAGTNLYGSDNLVTGGNNDAIYLQGNTNTLTLGANSVVSDNGISNTETADDAYVNLNGTSDTLDLTNSTVAAQDGSVFIATGDNNQIYTGNNTSGAVYGNSNTLYERGTNAGFNIQTSNGGTDTIDQNGAGDYAGLLGGSGYQVNLDGQSGNSIQTWDGTTFSVAGDGGTVDLSPADSLSLNGDNTVVNADNYAAFTVTGTNDLVNENGVYDTGNVQNTGSGTDTVDQNGANDYAGLLGGTGYQVNLDGQGGNATATSLGTSFTVDGDNGTEDLSLGDSLDLLGNGDVVNAGDYAAFTVTGTGTGDQVKLNVGSFGFTRFGTIDGTVTSVAFNVLPTDQANHAATDAARAQHEDQDAPSATPLTDLVLGARVRPDRLGVAGPDGRAIPSSTGMTMIPTTNKELASLRRWVAATV